MFGREVSRKKGEIGWGLGGGQEGEQYQDVGKVSRGFKVHCLGFAQYFFFKYILENFAIRFSKARSPTYSVL